MKTITILAESYNGVVEYKFRNDTITVVYEVNGSVVEQTYVRNQFLGGLPEVGTKLIVCVQILSVESDESDEPDATDESVKEPTRRRSITEPLEF